MEPQHPPERHPQERHPPETYNAWTVVDLVFSHLAAKGLHPVLGETGDPGVPAAALLRALGVEPRFEGDRRVMEGVHEHLAVLREAVFGGSDREGGSGVTPVST